MERLQFIVSKPCPFGSVDFDEHCAAIQSAEAHGHIPATLGYLHGQVEKVMGYDTGVCLNSEVYSDTDGNIIPGIYAADVQDYPNVCLAFMWTAFDFNYPRCLIVDTTNREDMAFATQAFIEKRENL